MNLNKITDMSTNMSTNESTSMNTPAPRSLNGITLEKILEQLVAYYGWEQMGQMVDINCFKSDPSIKSSLKFLRKTPWARVKVEELYLGMPG